MYTQTQRLQLILCAGWMFLDEEEESPLLRALSRIPYNHATDLLDGTRRTGTSTPHHRRWWERTARHISSEQFINSFRMRKTTFAKLVKMLYGTTGMCRKGSRGPYFDPCERVGIFLFRLGGDVGVKRVALQFELSEGLVSQATLEVARLIMERLYSKFVRWPSPEEQGEMSADWEIEKALRNVIGAIDGSHIKTLAPPESQKLAHYNYKQFYSIVLLAIVDIDGVFRWFCCGAPGSCSDSGTLQGTTFYKLVEREQAQPVASRRLLADGACILGDSAFAEGPWMRTPIVMPSTRAERFFNYKHSSMRFRVEHAFGRLKMRFVSLRKGLDCNHKHCTLLVNACVVLHNFIFMQEGASPWEDKIDNAPTRNGTGRSWAEGAGSETSARAAEVANLARAGFLRREWGAPGSRAELARQADQRRMREVQRLEDD